MCMLHAITMLPKCTHRTIDLHRENMKKKRRELEQASLDAASDLLDTDSNATFAMVYLNLLHFVHQFFVFLIEFNLSTMLPERNTEAIG